MLMVRLNLQNRFSKIEEFKKKGLLQSLFQDTSIILYI